MPDIERTHGKALKDKAGILPRKFSNMHTIAPVRWAVEQARYSGQEVSQTPREIKVASIGAYLDSLDGRHGLFGGNAERRERQIAHHVIKAEDVPESYFEAQQRMAREQGHGHIEINQELRDAQTEIIIADQKASLTRWVDYINHPDAGYPTWFKYFALQGVLKLGKYQPPEAPEGEDAARRSGHFQKRNKSTVAPFAELNREALAIVYNNLTNGSDGKESDANFGRLYAQAIEQSKPVNPELRKTVEGEWVKYEQGSDAAGKERAKALASSLEGYGTEWCTAGDATAITQLSGGDFYVFYSKDEEGNAKVPRVAIRMERGEVAEVRGTLTDQEMEPEMIDIAMDKVKNLPGGELYATRAADMKFLTTVETKHNEGDDLSVAELQFLYELDRKIEGFGYKRDPRIDTIKKQRRVKKDFSKICDCDEEQVAEFDFDMPEGTVVLAGNLISQPVGHSAVDALPESLRFIYGSINLNSEKITSLGNVEAIWGNLSVGPYSPVTDLGALRFIGKSLIAEPSKLGTLGSLERVNGDVYLPESIGDLGQLRHVKGDFRAGGWQLTSLGNLETVGKDLRLNASIVQDLGSLRTVGGDFFVEQSILQSLGGLVSIGGDARLPMVLQDLGALEKVEGIISLGDTQVTDLGNLESAGAVYMEDTQITSLGKLRSVGEIEAAHSSLIDLGQLESISGDAYFTNTRLQTLGKLQRVGKSLDISQSDLRDTGSLQYVGEHFFAVDTRLTSLGQVEHVGGLLDFQDSRVTDLGELHYVGDLVRLQGTVVTSLGKLESIGGTIILRDTEVRDLGQLSHIGGDADLSFSEIPDLGVLQHVGGNLSLQGTQVTDLGNLKNVGGDASFPYTLQNLGALESVGGDVHLQDTAIRDLGQLREVGGDLDVTNTYVTDISGLEHIGGRADVSPRRGVEKKVSVAGEQQKLVFGAGASEAEAPRKPISNIVFENGNEFVAEAELDIEDDGLNLTI